MRTWTPEKQKAYMKEYKRRPEVIVRLNKRAREVRQLWHRVVLLAYGAKCVCCGESEFKFLTIDHINGRGKEKRKAECGNTYRTIIRANFPPEFQLLCWNCNGAKGVYGRCPHQESREDIAKMELQLAEEVK